MSSYFSSLPYMAFLFRLAGEALASLFLAMLCNSCELLSSAVPPGAS